MATIIRSGIGNKILIGAYTSSGVYNWLFFF